MADFRKETYGAGSMKGVNLVVIAYDKKVGKKEDGEIASHYLDVRIHPEDRRAAGQTNLALVSKKDEKSPSGYNNSARYTPGQFSAIVAAAGDNVTDLTDKDANVIGKIYGVNSDVMVARDGVIANTKTIAASEYSVQPDADGKDILGRVFESMKAAKAAKEAAKATPEVQQAEPAVQSDLVLVGTERVDAAIDEPGLG